MSTATAQAAAMGITVLPPDVDATIADKPKGEDPQAVAGIDVTTVGPKVTDQTWEAIGKLTESPPTLYLSGDMPHLFRPADGNGPARILEASVDTFRTWLGRRVEFYKVTRKKPHEVYPPDALLKFMLYDRHPPVPLPRLTGITDVPVIGPDGRIDTTPGYQERTGFLYVPAEGCIIPPIPDVPTDADVAAAVTKIDEMIGEFPWDCPASRANAFALLVTAAVRHLIDGAVPPFGIDGSMPGSGKGKLRKALTYPALGERGLVSGTPLKDEAELRKNITSKLLAKDALFVMDNVGQLLDSGAFASATTERMWGDRILGGNRVVNLPMDLIFCVIGNQLRYSSEVARRVVAIRLEPNTDHPERQTFKITDLDRWVREHRGEIVGAAYTLVRNWFAKDCPKPGEKVPLKGSYEQWRRIVGGILGAAKIAEFLGNDISTQIEGDDREAQNAEFVQLWWRRNGSEEQSTKDLVDLAEIAGMTFRDPEKKPAGLGYRLRKLKGRVFHGGLKVVKPPRGHSNVWTLQWIGKGPPVSREAPKEQPPGARATITMQDLQDYPF